MDESIITMKIFDARMNKLDTNNYYGNSFNLHPWLMISKEMYTPGHNLMAMQQFLMITLIIIIIRNHHRSLLVGRREISMGHSMALKIMIIIILLLVMLSPLDTIKFD